MEFKHTQLENGLTVLAEVNPAAASLAAGIFVRTGARDEQSQESGVSHFLEHMMFKGTQRGRTASDVYREFDDIGAENNAFTTEESTVYYAAVLPEFQDRMLDLLCDMLRPSLKQEEFDVEKQVILEEIALYDDQPRFRVFDELMQTFFHGQTLGNRILGTKQSVGAMTPVQMRAYFDRRYSPGNMIIVATGKVDYDAFVHKVRDMCGNWPAVETSREIWPAQSRSQQRILFDSKVTREHMGLMSPGPARQDIARLAANLAGTVFGDSSGSRLYYALIEPAIADDATMAYESFDGTGSFMTFLSTDPDRAGEAVGIVREELRKFVESGPTEEELQEAKNKTTTGMTLRGELPMGRLASVSFDWLYNREYITLQDAIDRRFAITRQQVLDVVRKYDIATTTLLALGPCKEL